MTPPTSTSAFMAISSAVPQLTGADARGQGIWGATGSFGGVPRGVQGRKCSLSDQKGEKQHQKGTYLAKSARFRIKKGEINIKEKGSLKIASQHEFIIQLNIISFYTYTPNQTDLFLNCPENK